MDTLLELQQKTGQNFDKADILRDFLSPVQTFGSRNSFKFRLRRFNVPSLSNLGSNFWGNRYQLNFPSRDGVLRNVYLLLKRQAIDTDAHPSSEWAKDTVLKLIKNIRISCGSSHFYDETIKHTVLGALTKMKNQHRRQALRKFFGTQGTDEMQLLLPICLPNCMLHFPKCLDGIRPTPLFDISRLSSALNIEVEFDTSDKCITSSGTASLSSKVELVFEELICSDALKNQVRTTIPQEWNVMSYSEKTANTNNSVETVVNVDDLVASYHTRCFYLLSGLPSDYDTNLDVFKNTNANPPKSLFVDINGVETFEFEDDEIKHTKFRRFIQNNKPQQPDLEASSEEPYMSLRFEIKLMSIFI